MPINARKDGKNRGISQQIKPFQIPNQRKIIQLCNYVLYFDQCSEQK